MATRYDGDWQSSKKTVLERNTYMFNNSLFSDISFTCGESRRVFHAHKYVLATSSAVFEAMFYGDLAEKESTVCIPETEEDSFQEFLRFLYTDDCKVTAENAIGVMYLAKKYLIPPLVEKCCKVLEANIKSDNVFTVLEHVIRFDEKELEGKCWEIVSKATAEAVSTEGFCNISSRTLNDLLKRETLTITEVELFEAVLRWVDSECARQGMKIEDDNAARRRVLGDSVYDIRFLAMSQEDFAKFVTSCGILTETEIISLFKKFSGLDVVGLKWKDKQKRRSMRVVSFKRFGETGQVPSPWGYGGGSDALTLVVNKAVLFRGVRLFGNCNGSKYEVKFTTKDENVTGTYTSEKDDGVWGYDVMLTKPISLSPNEDVTIIARIKGPESDRGNYGKSSVKVGDIVVTFKNAPSGESSNGTSKTGGQFYKVYLSEL